MSEETVAQFPASPGSDPAFKLFGRTIPLLLEDTNDDSGSSEVTKVSGSNPEQAQETVKTEDFKKENEEEEEKGASSATNLEETQVPKKPLKILPCPRCGSTDTKFCYFNNYNVNQPRHFCRNCQRYWTAGGLLRNVPVGSGRRKNKHPGMMRTLGCSEGRVFVPQDCPSSEESVKFEGSFGPKVGLVNLESCGENNLQMIHVSGKPLWDSNSGGQDGENDGSSDCTGGKIPKLEVVKDQKRSIPEFPNGGFDGQFWPFFYSGFVGNLPYPLLAVPEVPSNAELKPLPNPWFQTGFGGYPWPVWGQPEWVPPWGIIPFTPPPSSSSSLHSSSSSVLGKRCREDGEKRITSDGSVWVPKTLRIDDPEEAAKSSIWSTLGFCSKGESVTSGGIFRAFKPNSEEDVNSQMQNNAEVLCANSRSDSFNENT